MAKKPLKGGKRTLEQRKLATARTYRARLLEKLHLKSNVEIVLYALHNKILDPTR